MIGNGITITASAHTQLQLQRAHNLSEISFRKIYFNKLSDQSN